MPNVDDNGVVRTTAELVVRQLLTAEFSSNGLGIHPDARSG